jgi:hypothetical protein
MSDTPDLIRRPDGSYVKLSELEPQKRLAHDLASDLFHRAVALNENLSAFKAFGLSEMRAYRDMMLGDYGVKVGGKEGGFSVRSACGTMVARLDVAKQVTFGPELEAAKALLDEFFEQELEGSSPAIREIVSKAFKLNSKGRLDTQGILGLRDFRFESDVWRRAMQAIDDAICRDSATTYLRVYQVDPERKSEKLVALDLAKV